MKENIDKIVTDFLKENEVMKDTCYEQLNLRVSGDYKAKYVEGQKILDNKLSKLLAIVSCYVIDKVISDKAS